MLINTVLLFLNNSLAIFIVLALLLSLKDKYKLSGLTIFIGGISGLFLIVLLWFVIDIITQSFDDTGLEWFYACVNVIIYLLIILLIYTLRQKKYYPIKQFTSIYAASILALIIMSEGTGFFIYSIGFWTQTNIDNSLFIGITLGVGVCVSIGILWYFFCQFLNENVYEASIECLLILFSCGLVYKASNLLLQIDVLPTTSIVWDLNFIVKESSELGYFLSALLGYDASPTLLQMMIYFTALLSALVLCLLLNKPWLFFSSKEVNS
jgi:high-affinity iron transporter